MKSTRLGITSKMKITSTTGKNGRLGNQIIRNLAVSLIAEKYNLKVDYFNKELIDKLGINLFSGENVHNKMHDLNDDNYFSIYNGDNLNYNLNPNQAYFQTKDISNLLYNYLHTDIIKSSIIEKNPFRNAYNENNNLFIHIRLTDTAKFNPGINYYLNTINSISYENLYISTDDKNHNIIQNIIQLYPNAIILDYDEITTFQFASTCKHIILSHGSFSALIGYLAFFSTVYYPEYNLDKIWYGDMFSIKNWIKK
jgi:hypothetical protein